MTGRYSWPNDPETGSFEDWVARMEKDGTFADEVFLQMVADTLHRDILIIPVFSDQVIIVVINIISKS